MPQQSCAFFIDLFLYQALSWLCGNFCHRRNIWIDFSHWKQARGEKNLDFSKLSNPANALGRLYFAAFFSVRKEGMNAKMSFGDGIARMWTMTECVMERRRTL